MRFPKNPFAVGLRATVAVIDAITILGIVRAKILYVGYAIGIVVLVGTAVTVVHVRRYLQLRPGTGPAA